MDVIRLVDSKVDLEEVVQSVSSSECGATSLFIGTTRDNFEGKSVSNYHTIIISLLT